MGGLDFIFPGTNTVLVVVGAVPDSRALILGPASAAAPIPSSMFSRSSWMLPRGLWEICQLIYAHGGLSHEGNHLPPAGEHPGPLEDLVPDDAVDRVLAQELLHPQGRLQHAHGIRRKLLHGLLAQRRHFRWRFCLLGDRRPSGVPRT